MAPHPGNEAVNRDEFDIDDFLPFDLLFLAIYNGPIHPSCVGPVFPNVGDIQERMNMTSHTTPLPTDDGEWILSFYNRKSKAELQRHARMEKAFESQEEFEKFKREEELKE